MFESLRCLVHRKKRKDGKTNVLLVCDSPNWAYDSIAKGLIKYNQNENLDLAIAYVKGGEPIQNIYKQYDLVFVLGWQLLAELRGGKIYEKMPFLNSANTLTGIHSHRAWDEGGTMPDRDVTPPDVLIEFLGRYRGVNAVSRRLAGLFNDAGLEDVVYTPNGVDAELFTPSARNGAEEPLKVGFTAKLKNDELKGISNLIEPACDMPDVVLVAKTGKDNNFVPNNEMPEFYNSIDVYICASNSEGFSMSVLEASACGRPIITTRVGGCEDLIVDGVNGFFIDRTVPSIREKVCYFLEHREAIALMGDKNRAIIEENWTAEKRAKDWLGFIETHL